MEAFMNQNKRIECNGVEFTSGDMVEVLIDGEWLETRIEHNGREYYSVDGYELLGRSVQYSRRGY